jgi:hypothetical protein
MYIPDHKTKNEDKQAKNTKQKTKNIMILSNGLADQTCFKHSIEITLSASSAQILCIFHNFFYHRLYDLIVI